MNWFEIIKENEIRCAYCLSWNSISSKVCLDCAAKLISEEEFGAARGVILTGECDPKRLDLFIKDEPKERILFWIELFSSQVAFLKKLTSDYDNIGTKLTQDLQEEIEKVVLREFPIKPEDFKKYREYNTPEESLTEIERLKYIFRCHPNETFKMLAGVALIYEGNIDRTIYNEVVVWRPRSEKLHEERLLSFAHWSVFLLNKNYSYQSNISEILPLLHKSGAVSSWAALFLYMAGHSEDELKYKLKDIIKSAPLQLGLSCALAMHDTEKVKKLLKTSNDICNLPLYLKYADIDDAPKLMDFLKFGPRYLSGGIIKKLSQLGSSNNDLRIQVIEWILEEGEVEDYELIFYWEEIPKLDEVVTKLLKTEEGFEKLSEVLPKWMDSSWQDGEMSDQLFDEIFNFEIPYGYNLQTSQALKQRILECKINKTSKKMDEQPNQETLAEILGLIVLENKYKLDNKLISNLLYALHRSAKFKTSNGLPLFSLDDLYLSTHCKSADYFTDKINSFLKDDELKRYTFLWMDKMCQSIAEVQVKPEYNPATIINFVNMLMENLLEQPSSNSLVNSLFKFIDSMKDSLGDISILEENLSKMREKFSSGDSEYWVNKILGN